MNLKYLKYAVGEIALVVIGILIALSINNWNEKRKDADIENEVVREMLASLETDHELFEYLIERLQENNQAIQQLLHLRERGHLISEDSLDVLLTTSRLSIAYSYDDSPYEAMVSLGINKFSKKELLNQIISYYSSKLPRMENLINDALKYYIPRIDAIEDQALKEKLFTKSFAKDESGEWVVVWSNDVKRILKSPTIEEYLLLNYELYESLISRMQQILRDNQSLIDSLKDKKSI